MAIDMAVLKSATYGDQDAKLSLKRAWLTEVHKELEAGQRAKAELAALKAQVEAHNERLRKEVPSDKQMAKGFGQMDKGMDQIFGDGGAFDTIFGTGKRKRK